MLTCSNLASTHPFVSACAIVQVWSSSRCPTSFQSACGPYNLTASAFCISTVRKQRKHSTRNMWWGTSERRHCRIGSGDRSAARGSARTASHNSSGNESAGAGSSAILISRRRAASRASFSICFGDGIRQLAGRSEVMVRPD